MTADRRGLRAPPGLYSEAERWYNKADAGNPRGAALSSSGRVSRYFAMARV